MCVMVLCCVTDSTDYGDCCGDAYDDDDVDGEDDDACYGYHDDECDEDEYWYVDEYGNVYGDM